MERLMRFGRYQAFYTAVMFVAVAQEYTHVVLLMLAGNKPTVQCNEGGDNGTTATIVPMWSACALWQSGRCADYQLHYEFHSWMIEWRLLCDRWRSYGDAGTMQFAGVFAGNLLFGQLSDAIGRKKAWLCCWLPLTALGILSALVDTAALYLSLMPAIGFFLGGVMTVPYTMLCEMTTSGARLYVRMVLAAAPVKMIAVVPAAYVLGDWRALTVAINAAALPAIVLFAWLSHESPQWLVRTGDTEAAVRAMHSVCNAWNGRAPPLSEAELRELVDGELRRDDGANTCAGSKRRRYYMWHLFCTGALAKKTAALALCWFTASLATWGIDLYVGELSGSVYANIFAMAFLRWATLGALMVIDRRVASFGRRTLHMCTSVPIAVCLCATAACLMYDSPQSTAVRLLSMAARGLVCGLWTSAKLMSAEQYPTGVRNAANSAGNMCSALAAAISPQMLLISPSAAFSVYGALVAGESAVFWLALAETKGRPLPQHMPPERSWLAVCRTGGRDAGGEGVHERTRLIDTGARGTQLF